MTDRELFLAAKENRKIPDLAKRNLLTRISEGSVDLTYYEICAFGLLFEYSNENEGIFRGLIREYISMQDDERLSAVIITVSNYWVRRSEFKAELEEISLGLNFENFPDSKAFALKAFADAIRETNDIDGFERLRATISANYYTMTEMEREFSAEGFLQAVLPLRKINRNLVKSVLKNDDLPKLTPNMTLAEVEDELG